MTTTLSADRWSATTSSQTVRRFIEGNGTRIWAETRGNGPDVLLIAGLSDTVEAWRFQLEGLAAGYRVTAFDNRGSGRTPLPDERLSLEMMADDAAAVVAALATGPVHIAGFSGGSMIAQELALRHPEVVRSLVLVSTWARTDPYFRSMVDFWTWMVAAAPSERAALEAFYLWIYTPQAHADGTVGRIIDELLEFPYPQPVEAFHRQLAAFATHDTTRRLNRIGVPTLVLAGENDMVTPPRMGRFVASLIPGACFEVVPQQAHQPFQEIPDWFNARIAEFWSHVEATKREDTRDSSSRSFGYGASGDIAPKEVCDAAR